MQVSDKLLEYHSHKERESNRVTCHIPYLLPAFSIKDGVFNQIQWYKDMYMIIYHINN